MQKSLRIAVLSLGLLLTIFGGSLVNHVSVMAMPHDMEVMNHTGSSSSSQLCATLCSTPIIYKNDKQSVVIENKKDKEAGALYYLQFRNDSYVSDSLNAQKPTDTDLPLKVPIYIQFGILRF